MTKRDTSILAIEGGQPAFDRPLNVGEPTSALFRRRDLADSQPDLLSFAGRRAASNGDASMWVTLLRKGDAVYLGAEPIKGMLETVPTPAETRELHMVEGWVLQHPSTLQEPLADRGVDRWREGRRCARCARTFTPITRSLRRSIRSPDFSYRCCSTVGAPESTRSMNTARSRRSARYGRCQLRKIAFSASGRSCTASQAASSRQKRSLSTAER